MLVDQIAGAFAYEFIQIRGEQMEKYTLSIMGLVVAVALVGFLMPNSITGNGAYYQGNLVKTQYGMVLVDDSESTAGLASSSPKTLTITNNLPVREETNSDNVVVRNIRVNKQLLAGHGVKVVGGKTVLEDGRKSVTITVE